MRQGELVKVPLSAFLSKRQLMKKLTIFRLTIKYCIHLPYCIKN